jgi:hypothetical protein
MNLTADYTDNADEKMKAAVQLLRVAVQWAKENG